MIREGRTGWVRIAVACLSVAAVVVSGVVVSDSTANAAPVSARAVTARRTPKMLLSPPIKRLKPRVPAGGYAPTPGTSARAAGTGASATELVSRRTAMSSTWRDRDGSLTVRQYGAPHYYRPSASVGWRPITTTLTAVPGHPGSYTSGANRWHATFAPTGSAGGTERLSLGSDHIALTPQNLGRDGTTPIAAGSTATYRNLWADTDVVDRVGPSGVEEDIVLRSRTAPATFRFDLQGATARANASGGLDLLSDGTVLASVPAPIVRIHAAESTEASGARLRTTGRLIEVSVSRTWLSALPASAFPVVIDPTVSFEGASPSSVAAFSSTGATSSTVAVGHNASGTWAGAFQLPPPAFPAQQTGQPWQITYAELDISCPGSCTLSAPKLYNEPTKPTSYATVSSGYLVPDLTTVGPGTLQARVETDSLYTSRQSAWFGLVANAPSGAYVQIPTANIMMVLTFTENPPPATLVSPANGSVLTTTTPTLTGHLTDANICPLTEARPAYCDDKIDLYYNFKISTAATASTGATVAESGWRTWPVTVSGTGVVTPATPTWTVPTGSLQDGATYYTVLAVANDPQYPSPPWSSLPAPEVDSTPTSFQIKQRLGAGGPSPSDAIGAPPGSSSTPSEGAPSPGTPPASESVDMVTGNLAFTLATRSMSAVSGDVGAKLSYDSIRSSVAGSNNYGLTARYYHDSGTHTFPTTVAGQRIDPSIDVTGSASTPPIGGIGVYTGYLVRWTGTLSVPTGTWQLGGVSTGGMRIYTGGASAPSYDDWVGNGRRTPTFATSTITGPRQLAIQVEAWEGGQNASSAIQLWANDTASAAPRTFVVQSDWLTPAATGLPAGWSLSTTAPGTDWTSVSDLGAQVVAHSITGATATFTKNNDGSYRPEPGSSDYLTLANGRLQLSTTTGVQYTFNPDGSLASATTAVDDRHPASVQYTYGPDTSAVGNPTVLQSLTDPVSGRSITLAYGTATACPTTNTGGLLCAVTGWDGSKTSFTYNSNNQLAQVLSPGNTATLFAYDTSNRVAQIRDPLANDYIASAQPGIPVACTTTATSATCPLDTQIGYDTQGRVTSVLQPAPAIGAARPQRTYTYGAGTTTAKIAGFTPTSGVASSVTYDAKSRITRRSDAAGHSTATVWDLTDRPIISVDTTGEQTSTVYDVTNNITDTYGPAPVACFDPATVPAGATPIAPAKGYLPLAAAASTPGCVTTPPHSHRGYDETVTGPARTYWTNGQFAGAAALHATGSEGGPAVCAMNNPSNVQGDNTTSVCANWPTGSAPVATDAQHKWSERISGSWTPPPAPAATGIAFYLQASQPFTLLVDGVPVLTNITYSANGTPTGVKTTVVSAAIKVTNNGPHHLDMQFQGDSSAQSSYYLVYAPLPSLRYASMTLTSIDPGYGLETSTTDADGKTTTTGYTGGGLDAQYAMATSTTSDPQGLALTTSTTYETPGPTTYLRPLSQRLPAGTTTSYGYYGGTDGPLAAACGVPAGTAQGGRLQTQIDAATAGPAAREQQFIYDAAGRVAGRRVGTTTGISSAGWQCSTYDARGRIVQQNWPAFNGAPIRTVTYTYAVGGDPTKTSVSDTSDPGATITTKVDLLGRLASYTDALGQTTISTYDQAGRPTGSSGLQGSLSTTYDSQTSQIASVTRNGTTLATPSYDPTNGRLTKVGYRNGTTGTLTYGPSGNLRGTTYTNTATGAFVTGDITTLSAAGRIVSEQENITGTALSNPNPAGADAVDYTYDGAGRLVSAVLPGALASYGYDPNPAADACPVAAAGNNTNRTRVTLTPTGGTAASTDFCYNQADQLTSTIAGSTRNTQYAYDAHGNQTNDHGTTLIWDAADRLVKTTSATGVVTTYSYDALDRVITRTTGTSTVNYAYNEFSSGPAATLTAAGTIDQQFITVANGVLLTVQASGERWSYPDMHDNYTVITDSSGARQGSPVTFDPWGQPNGGATPVDNARGSSKLGAFGMDGKITDTATGITIMGARPYNAAEGRFLGIDPVVGGCANAYTYTYGDPLTQQDLDGRDHCGHLTVVDALDIAVALRGTGRLGQLAAKFGVGGPIAAALEETLALSATYYGDLIEAVADTAAFLAKRERRKGFPKATGMVLVDWVTIKLFGHDTGVPIGVPLFLPYVANGSGGGGGTGGSPGC